MLDQGESIARLEAWSEGHEQLCEERQKTIISLIGAVDQSVRKQQSYLLGVAGISFMTLLAIVGFLLKPYFQ